MYVLDIQIIFYTAMSHRIIIFLCKTLFYGFLSQMSGINHWPVMDVTFLNASKTQKIPSINVMHTACKKIPGQANVFIEVILRFVLLLTVSPSYWSQQMQIYTSIPVML